MAPRSEEEGKERTHPPRTILAYWSPNFSFIAVEMPSSILLGQSAWQMAMSAYMRSAVLLI